MTKDVPCLYAICNIARSRLSIIISKLSLATVHLYEPGRPTLISRICVYMPRLLNGEYRLEPNANEN